MLSLNYWGQLIRNKNIRSLVQFNRVISRPQQGRAQLLNPTFKFQTGRVFCALRSVAPSLSRSVAKSSTDPVVRDCELQLLNFHLIQISEKCVGCTADVSITLSRWDMQWRRRSGMARVRHQNHMAFNFWRHPGNMMHLCTSTQTLFSITRSVRRNKHLRLFICALKKRLHVSHFAKSYSLECGNEEPKTVTEKKKGTKVCWVNILGY